MDEPDNADDRDQLLLLTLDGLLARSGGDYDPAARTRQAAALVRHIGTHYISVDTAAFLISHAREHELMAIIDFVADIPRAAVSRGTTAIACFAGERATIIRNDRQTDATEPVSRSSSVPPPTV